MTTIVWLTEDDDGYEQEFRIPAKWEICDDCEGDGTVLRDGLRGVAFTQEEMNEDPDFAESYFSGAYDVPCQTCTGSGKVKVPDERRAKPEVLARYQQEQANIAADQRMSRIERDLGY